jgi:hypothetical protein
MPKGISLSVKYDDDEWELRRPQIQHLWIECGLTLGQVQSLLAAENFNATSVVTYKLHPARLIETTANLPTNV